jgi:hypothetical protein
MRRRTLILLLSLGLLATAGGVAGGLLLARDGGVEPATAGTTSLPEVTTTETSASTTSTSTSTTAPTSTTTGLTLQAQVVQRLEDGLMVRYQASQPVTAVLTWGVGAPRGNQVAFAGPAARGTVKLTLTKTNSPVALRVTGRAADGRAASSRTLSARRLIRRVVLEVRQLTLEIPPSGTSGITTSFLGTSYTPIGPGENGPQASSGPYAFPAAALAAGTGGATLQVKLYYQEPGEPQQTGVAGIAVSFPGPGRSATLTRTVSRFGVDAHLTLRVTVTIS